MSQSAFWLRTGAVALLAAIYVPPVYHTLEVFGLFRQAANTHLNGTDVFIIDDTINCEDVHHHGPSNTIFTACEDSTTTRLSWFPGLSILEDPVMAMNSQGSIHVVDPKTFKSKRLQFEDFTGPFITHGIDVISDGADSVYIFAVNHLPNPEYVAYKMSGEQGPFESPKAQSQIEVFHHALGSSKVKHVRSIRHPLIRTPNDVLAQSPTSLFVTNDHYYTEGRMRLVEDIYPRAKWTDTVHVQIDQLSNVKEPTDGLNVTIAVTGLHNNNGLGISEVGMAIGSASSGMLHLARMNGQVVESIPIDSAIDNPSFFQGSKTAGYVLGGLSRAVDLPNTIHDAEGKDPVIVWFVRRKNDGWEKIILFQDDGTRISSSSAAVLVENTDGSTHLLVTGFKSRSMIAVKVNLPE